MVLDFKRESSTFNLNICIYYGDINMTINDSKY